MEIDKFGNRHLSADELCALIYVDPEVNINQVLVDNPEQYNQSLKVLHYRVEPLAKYVVPTVSLEKFDSINQSVWHMPDSYKKFDIAQWVLAQCQTEEELQRVGKELLLFQDRDLFDLLRFMKYFVDTMRRNNVVWGVGRGSSVASYVLFLIGVHRIDSLFFQLEIEEFLKDLPEQQ